MQSENMSSSQALIRLTNFLYCGQSNFFIHKETGLNTEADGGGGRAGEVESAGKNPR